MRSPSPARLVLVAGLLAVGLGDLVYLHLGVLPRYLAGGQMPWSAHTPSAVTVNALVVPPRAPAAAQPLPAQANAAATPLQADLVPVLGAVHAAPSTPLARPPEAAAPVQPPEARASAQPAESFSELLFARNTTWLSAPSRATLDRLAQTLKQAPERRVLLSGHSDRIGPRELNRWLSRARAYRAAGYLRARGVEPSRIDIQSFGSTRPAVTETSSAAWARNRRVEIELH